MYYILSRSYVYYNYGNINTNEQDCESIRRLILYVKLGFVWYIYVYL